MYLWVVVVLVMLQIFIKFQRRRKKVENKIVEYNLQIQAHNTSGFDTWITKHILSCDKHILDIIKNGNSVFELKIFNGYISVNNIETSSPKPTFYIWNKSSKLFVKKMGKTFILQKQLL